ncbi:hypothetical protein LCGC14_2468410 [marine sediment metagenome]|uniref:Uncharacterized protein n=1 Tax=marine sediment metagenome TaxID=412755 RepID=A0A0F9DN75_9ZZZZ
MPFWLPYNAETWEELARQVSRGGGDSEGKTFWSPNSYALMAQAKTLQERVFARLFTSLIGDTEIRFMHQGSIATSVEPHYSIELKRKSLRGLMAACKRSPEVRKALSRIPFVQRTTVTHGDPEIHICLQDLADIVCWEASESFTSSYFPGVVQVDALEPDHVKLIMSSMQREMDREGNRTGIVPAVFEELPWERQVALAERRRWWFNVYGISPKRCKKGYFNRWNVSNTLTWPPDGYYCRWDKILAAI